MLSRTQGRRIRLMQQGMRSSHSTPLLSLLLFPMQLRQRRGAVASGMGRGIASSSYLSRGDDQVAWGSLPMPSSSDPVPEQWRRQSSHYLQQNFSRHGRWTQWSWQLMALFVLSSVCSTGALLNPPIFFCNNTAPGSDSCPMCMAGNACNVSGARDYETRTRTHTTQQFQRHFVCLAGPQPVCVCGQVLLRPALLQHPRNSSYCWAHRRYSIPRRQHLQGEPRFTQRGGARVFCTT